MAWAGTARHTAIVMTQIVHRTNAKSGNQWRPDTQLVTRECALGWGWRLVWNIEMSGDRHRQCRSGLSTYTDLFKNAYVANTKLLSPGCHRSITAAHPYLQLSFVRNGASRGRFFGFQCGCSILHHSRSTRRHLRDARHKASRPDHPGRSQPISRSEHDQNWIPSRLLPDGLFRGVPLTPFCAWVLVGA